MPFSLQECEFDVIYGSDILYDPEGYDDLLATLRLLRFKKLLVTYKRRHVRLGKLLE